MSLSPTQRTLKALREQGCLCGNVERFNPHAGPHGIRQDLFGFIDLIAIYPERGIVAIQSCGQDFAGHIRKMTEERNEAMYEWLKHAPVELWGWRRKKIRRGGKALRWFPRIADFWLDEETKEIKWAERGKGHIRPAVRKAYSD